MKNITLSIDGLRPKRAESRRRAKSSLNSRARPKGGWGRTGSGIGRMLMRAECFLDTNVLLYLALGSKDDPAKYKRSLALLSEASFGLSAQVLQEFYVNAVRKSRRPLPPERALEWIEEFEQFPCVDITPGLVKIAIELSERYRIDYWDGAIIAAAERLDAAILYTEDLNHEQLYGSVRVINPFL
jgi:predicted nucleic acid-binding protein